MSDMQFGDTFVFRVRVTSFLWEISDKPGSLARLFFLGNRADVLAVFESLMGIVTEQAPTWRTEGTPGPFWSPPHCRYSDPNEMHTRVVYPLPR